MESIPKYLFYFQPNHHSSGFKHLLYASENAVEDITHFNFEKESAFFINYDLKNVIEAKLVSENSSFYEVPNFIGIYPSLALEQSAAKDYFNRIIDQEKYGSLDFKSLTKTEYIRHFEMIQKHIQMGNIYEMNYCIAFHTRGRINPFATYHALNGISHAPFSAFVKLDQQYMISSSPERYLKQIGSKLTTEPIKGTSKRFLNETEDLQSKYELQNSLKDKTENIMIVDVARNDLSRIARRNSVNVDECCEVYAFEQVYQMISKVSCEVKAGISFQDIVNATFPMASMTGAPKIRAMQLIDEMEDFTRTSYSGTIGYSHQHEIDSSVLIRSIFYNAETEDVWFAVGSAITAASNPNDEWEELMLKANAMQKVLASF